MDTTRTLMAALGIEVEGETDKGYKCRCPNPDHDDQHPSAFVFKDTGWVYCNSCGFSVGLRAMAKLKGIPVPVTPYRSWHPYEEKPYEYREFVIIENGLNVRIASDGDWHKEYRAWKASRGISGAFLDHFQCLLWFQGMFRYEGDLEAQQCPHRLAIPCCDDKGRLIGYEFRKFKDFDNDLMPKVWYPKGFPRGKFVWNQDGIDAFQPVYGAEGILDLTKLFDTGITNVIATYGSGVTQKQLGFIKAIPLLIWCMDRDEAGLKVVQEISRAREGKLRVMIPFGSDPGADTLEQTQEALRNRIVTVDTLLNKVDREWLLDNDPMRTTDIQYMEDDDGTL